MNLHVIWSCSGTTVILLRAYDLYYIVATYAEKYISYYLVLLTGTQNRLNTHSSVYTAMCASVLTVFLTQLFFFIYPETNREKALRQEKEKKKNSRSSGCVFYELATWMGIFSWKKDYQLLKMSMTRLHFDVVVYGGRFVILEKRVIVTFGTIFCCQHDFHSLFPISHDSRNDTLSMTIL